MDKVVNISQDIYPILEVLDDLNKIKDNIKDLVFVTFTTDGTAYVSHTGLSFLNMALACKLMDKEFNNMVDFDNAEE